MARRPSVVIIGAGFGGLQCARKLGGADVDVTLLDRHNFHLFTPLLYQVSTSLLNPSDIAKPVRSIFRGVTNVRFHLADVVGGDLDARVIRTRAGQEFGYDYLVVATGSTTNFFGQQDIERRAHTVKELSDALEFRNHVLRCFEAADLETDLAKRQKWLTFVVVGAGPTGVEYAGALSELFDLAVRVDYPDCRREEFRILLIEGKSQVLPAFPERLGQAARRELEARGVEVLVDTLVDGLDGDRVRLSNGATIESRTLAWAAGVKPTELAEALNLERTPSGRVRVDEQLRAIGRERVFAIGDLAAAPAERGDELPMMAPQAMQEGRHVARCILSELRGRVSKPFHFRDKGVMATIGRNAGVARIGRVHLKGLVGWAAYLLVHLYYLIGFRNRVAVFLEWAWDYLRYDRPIRIIARADRAKLGDDLP